MDIVYFGWLAEPVEMDRGNQLDEYLLIDSVLIDCSRNYLEGKGPLQQKISYCVFHGQLNLLQGLQGTYN